MFSMLSLALLRPETWVTTLFSVLFSIMFMLGASYLMARFAEWTVRR